MLNDLNRIHDLKYVIQIFKASSEDPLVGYWSNTNWGSYKLEKTVKNAEEIFATGKFAGIRVVEIIWEKYRGKSSE